MLVGSFYWILGVEWPRGLDLDQACARILGLLAPGARINGSWILRHLTKGKQGAA
jgi:hypothetical protein